MIVAMSMSGVPEILQTGLAGLCFLLALLAFRLISQEQKRDANPRKGILRTIYLFIAANFVTAVLVGAAALLERRSDPAQAAEVKQLREQAAAANRLEVELKAAVAERDGLAANVKAQATDLASVRTDLQKQAERVQQYRLAMTALVTAVDGKVELEMERVKAGDAPLPALRIYINKLESIMKKARADGLVD